MMLPADDFYSKLAQECNGEGISVDLFFGPMPNVQLDLATIAPIAGSTGGEMHYYEDFDAAHHGEKLYYELFRNLTRNQVTDVQLKMRVSTGLSVTEYVGSFMNQQAADLAIASLNADSVLSICIRNDEKLTAGQVVFGQFAMLYNDTEGQTKIRVFNY